jgi:hypothetical protein
MPKTTGSAAHPEQQGLDPPPGIKRDCGADHHPRNGQTQPLAEHQAQYMADPCAEGDAHAELVRPLRHVVRDHTVQPDRRHHQREPPNATNMVAPRRHERMVGATVCSSGVTVTYDDPGINDCNPRRTDSCASAAPPRVRTNSPPPLA